MAPNTPRPADRARRGAAAIAVACLVAIGCAPSATVVAQESARRDWQPHPGNPIIPAGALRDKGLWNDPSVVKLDDGTYAMYLTTSTEEPFKPPILPFRAVSRDGIAWRLDPPEPLLRPVAPYINIETPTVVRFKGKWHMYYMGVMPPGSVPASHIGHAVSDDGIRWRHDPAGARVVSATGTVADWNGFMVSEPGAVVFKDRIYLYFAALGARPGLKPPQLQTIGLATSADGTTFTAPRQVLSADERVFPPAKGFTGYATVSAVVDGGRMHLFYNVISNPKLTGSDVEQVALHHSWSADGESGWHQDPRPIFNRSDFDWTDGGGIISPTVIVEGGKVRMWFAGHMSKLSFAKLIFAGWKGRQFGVGYAEAPAERVLDPKR